MKIVPLSDDTVPTFCWDRPLTVGELRAQLRAAGGDEWIRLASWILREAATPDVWTFLTPAEVRDRLPELKPFLGRRRDFWEYIIGAWRELGKL